MKTLFLALAVLAISVDALSWKTFLRRSHDDASDLAELGRKWGVLCDMFDVNRNERVGPNDINTIITNFLQVNSIPPSDIETVRNQFRDFWATFVVCRPNIDTVTREEYIQIRRDLYTSNRIQFNTNIQNSMSAFEKFIDLNNDGFVVLAEIHKFSRVFEIDPLPHWDALLEHYRESGIPIEIVSKNIILFMETPAENEFQELFEGGVEEDHD